MARKRVGTGLSHEPPMAPPDPDHPYYTKCTHCDLEARYHYNAVPLPPWELGRSGDGTRWAVRGNRESRSTLSKREKASHHAFAGNPPRTPAAAWGGITSESMTKMRVSGTWCRVAAHALCTRCRSPMADHVWGGRGTRPTPCDGFDMPDVPETWSCLTCGYPGVVHDIEPSSAWSADRSIVGKPPRCFRPHQFQT